MTDALLRLAERSVAAGRKAGAEGAEAFVQREAGGSVSLEKNDLSSAEWSEEFGIGLRAVRKGRVGFAYVSRAERLSAGWKEALQSAALGKELPAFRFPAPTKVPRVAGVLDPRILDLEGEDLVGAARQLVESVQGVRRDLVVAGGGVSAGWTDVAVANSEGVGVASRATGMSASVYVVQSRDGVSTGFASSDSTRRDVRADAVGREAGALAVSAAKPKPLSKGGPLPCLVRPDPAGDLLSTITLASLEGRTAHRRESYYSGKVGRSIMHSRVSLLEDPRTPGGLGSAPFDDEGVASRLLRPVARGVLRSFFYDAATAREFGGRSTASAVRSHAFEGRSYKSPPTAGSRQVRLEAPARATEKLIAGVDRGLLVHDMMGVHTANTVSGDFSVTSSLLFRIERGAVAGPVRPLSIAGNLHRELRRGLTMGDDLKRMGGDGGMDLPSLLFEGFTVTP